MVPQDAKAHQEVRVSGLIDAILLAATLGAYRTKYNANTQQPYISRE